MNLSNRETLVSDMNSFLLKFHRDINARLQTKSPATIMTVSLDERDLAHLTHVITHHLLVPYYVPSRCSDWRYLVDARKEEGDRQKISKYIDTLHRHCLRVPTAAAIDQIDTLPYAQIRPGSTVPAAETNYRIWSSVVSR